MGWNAAGEVVGRFYEAFDAGNIDAALSVCADDLEIIDPGMGQVRGRDRFREYLETFKRAMPDARAIVEQTVESGETVAVEGRFTGTQTGPLATEDGDVAELSPVVQGLRRPFAHPAPPMGSGRCLCSNDSVVSVCTWSPRQLRVDGATHEGWPA